MIPLPSEPILKIVWSVCFKLYEVSKYYRKPLQTILQLQKPDNQQKNQVQIDDLERQKYKLYVKVYYP